MRFNKVKSKTIWKSKYGYELHEDKFVYRDKEHVYNYISRVPGYVAIVAIDKDNKIYLVKNFRYAIKKFVYEVPMGYIEKNESPLVAAQRELREETGVKADSWTKIDTFNVAPGFMNIKCHLFLAQNLEINKNFLEPDALEVQIVKTDIGKIAKSSEPITRISYYYLKSLNIK